MKKIALTFVVFALMLLCGCAGTNIQELYSLPKPQEEYLQLQELIDAEIRAGSEYSAPTTGSNLKPVQMANLNGAASEEFLVFMKNKDQVPVIHIYREANGEYELATTIVGEGSAIDRVEYSDLDGDGDLEILVSWEISTEIMTMKAYTVKDWTTAVILSTNCTDFLLGEFNAKGGSDVAVLNFTEEGGQVQLFFIDEVGEVEENTVALSKSLTYADRFRIDSGLPAVFVEGHYEDEETEWYLTDILVYTDGLLRNITMDKTTGNSRAQRSSAVYSVDIDGNGTLEVPSSKLLHKQEGVTADYYVFDWFSYDINGESELSASTYHAYIDGWYYEIPEDWRDSLTVRRESGRIGERTLVLSTVDEASGKVTDRLKIFTLTDENRKERANLPGRFPLAPEGATMYAAIYINPDGSPATQEQQDDVISRFNLIYSEWITGAV